jgi:YVTN family beta-propeller protein
VTLSPDGSVAYVSNWGEESVTAIDLGTRTAIGQIKVGTHPNALATNPVAARHQVAVANGDSDTISLIDTSTNEVTRTISLAPFKNAPVGTQPNALAFSPDGETLYSANAGDNDVDVISVSGGVRGMIPTAWYPTAIDVSNNGKTLFIANAKGLGDGPNPNYKQGVFGPPNQYAPAMMHGTLQIVTVPGEGQLEKYTEQVRKNDGFGENEEMDSAIIPQRAGQDSPIKHVIYVVKENRTYDQVFGNLGRGNGDPTLTLFGDESAPNIRALAQHFVLLDNFYAASEVSADGWSWSTEATANTYDQKTFPENYSDVNRGRAYDWEGGNYAAAAGRNPKDSYLWDRLADHGVSFRNYGFFTQFGTTPPNVMPAQTAPNLVGRTDPSFEGYNLTFADSPLSPLATSAKPSRISEWQREFAGYVANPSTFPTLEFVRLPNDHTAGTRPGAPTPRAYVADNDYALGLLVQTVSHSPFWKDTAIFVVEDDAQDGPDHVDAHRTEALVISPYTQAGRIDSTFYSTVSMLHTIELIVGVQPMTQFDAGATPMWKSFTTHPNFAPYTAMVPAYPMNTLNGASAPLAAQMAGLSDTQADNMPDQVLNEAIWKSVKGDDSAMPGARSDTDG